MKQHITMGQLRELDSISNEVLRDFFNIPFVGGDPDQQCYRLTGHEYESGICKICFTPSHEKKKSGELLLSIGQMIEFLDDKVPGKWSIDNTDSDGWYVGGGNMNIYPKGSSDSLGPCDALWEAVKELSKD